MRIMVILLRSLRSANRKNEKLNKIAHYEEIKCLLEFAPHLNGHFDRC